MFRIIFIRKKQPSRKIDLCRGWLFASVIREISEISAAVRGLQNGYQIRRVCFPPEVKGEIATLYHRNNG